ncbi:MAG: major capsid protein [Actinomycetota bacterium]
MPNGNVTLLESVKDSSDKLRRGVVETIIQESSPLQRLPQVPIMGNAYKIDVEGDIIEPDFRDVNEGYTAKWASDRETYWGVAILGVEVKVDNFIVNTRGDKRSTKARMFAKAAKGAAHKYNKWFFDGTGTAKDFKGLNALIEDGHGQQFTTGVNGGAITLEGLDEAHDLLRTGEADQILSSRRVRRAITNLGRNLANGYSMIDVGDNEFGKQVLRWNGIEIGIVGDDPSGNLILDNDETVGTSTACSSLYFLRYGEDHVHGIMGANGHMDVRDFGETEAAPEHLGRMEFYPGLVVADQYAVVRYAGITD